MTTNPYQPPDAKVAAAGESTPPPAHFVWKIVRSVLGVVVGIVAGGVLVLLIEVPANLLHPPPPDFDMNEPEAVRAHMARAPFLALLSVGLAWMLGPLVGSFIAAAIARWAYFAHGMVLAAVFLSLTVMTIRSFPHPTWLVLVAVFGPLAAGWIGSALAEWMFAPKASDLRPDPKPYDMRKKNMAC